MNSETLPPTAPARPERTVKDYRIGDCSLCRCSVRRRGEDGPELVRQRGKLVPHEHKKPYTIRPDLPSQDSDRGWMDYARGMGAW